MNISEINKRLGHGEIKRIARIIGVTQNYVSMVLAGKRKSKKILQCAEMVIKERESADKAIQKNLKSSHE